MSECVDEGRFGDVKLDAGTQTEPCNGGYWSYFQRSPGRIPKTPLHQLIKWIIEQIALRHFRPVNDKDGEMVGLLIGRIAPRAAADQTAAHEAAEALGLALKLYGLFATAREKGSSPESIKTEQWIWQQLKPADARFLLEVHFGLVFCQLLGRLSKKFEKLELLPIFGTAPQQTREYLAEASRCYLLKMNRACIALCRACLEDTLDAALTAEMRAEWDREMRKNSRERGNSYPMLALIQVCGRNGILAGHEADADYIRKKANDILHLNNSSDNGGSNDLAGEVLKRTRTVIGAIHGNK